MSDDRVSQLENLYAAPAGSPSGGLFSGTLSAIPRGIGDASAQLDLQAKQLGLNLSEQAASALPDTYTQTLTGMSKDDAVHALQTEETANRQRQAEISNYIRPNPQTTGIVGNTLYGLADIVPRAVVGSIAGPYGAAALAGSSTGYQGYAEARAQGVDAHTAAAMGAIQGVTNAVGLVASPTLGVTGSALKQFVAGAAFNTALQEGGQELNSVVLRRNGYNAMADQYAQTDASSILADIVLGGYFGMKHGGMMSPELVDSAVQAKAQSMYQGEAAPGVPIDLPSINAHAEAMDTARQQLLTDQPVELGNTLARASFMPRDVTANAEQSREALTEAGYTRPPTSDEVAARFEQQMQDYAQAKAQYAAIPETEGGKVLSTDIARELSPGYLADRTLSAAVHEPASAFTKQAYAEALAKEPAEGQQPVVMFTAGGTGAGKTTSMENVESIKEAKATSQIVYDTNMNKFGSADSKIQQALAAGKNVKIVYTYREPVDALVNGALPRAEHQREKFGTGRTVPLDEHLNTHVGALETIKSIAEKYKDDKRVSIDVIDNSFGKGKQRVVNLDDIPDMAQNDVKENLTKALNDEYQAGKISPETYRGFAGEGAVRLPEVVERGDQGVSGQSGAQRPEGARAGHGEDRSEGAGDQDRGRVVESANAGTPEAGSRVPSPEENLARQIATETPDRQVTYLDDTGNPVTETAAEAMSRLDEEQGTMARMADAVRAAVSCALRFGE